LPYGIAKEKEMNDLVKDLEAILAHAYINGFRLEVKSERQRLAAKIGIAIDRHMHASLAEIKARLRRVENGQRSW
jgi:hypothetical protein